MSRVAPIRVAIRIVLGCLMAGQANAHSMDQSLAILKVDGREWSATFHIEAWSAYPEEGPRAPTMGEEGGIDTGMGWIRTLQPDDFQIIREKLAKDTREAFVLKLGGQPLEAGVSFPEFDKSPLVLRENENRTALIEVILSGLLPQDAAGPLELEWKDREEMPLTVEVAVKGDNGWNQTSVHRVEANDGRYPLARIGSSGGVTESRRSDLREWIVAGFEHILPKGLDHILFILGLFLLQPKVRPLLAQSLAFTVAHSITLALVVLGVFTVPSRIVESMIALSIAYVGIENLWAREVKPWRLALVFALGLLHGMGFASVMKELELPSDTIIGPLVGFNMGVELGQVAVLLAAFASWRSAEFLLGRGRTSPPELVMRRGAMAASAAIGCIGLYWTFERALG